MVKQIKERISELRNRRQRRKEQKIEQLEEEVKSLIKEKYGIESENVATYPLEGKTPAIFMQENFGRHTAPEDEPDEEPTEQIMIEFED